MGSVQESHLRKDHLMSEAVRDERNVRETRNTNVGLAESVQGFLADLDEKLVLAESCTGGDVVATMTRLPGISTHLCGSLVTYRPTAKQKWLGVRPRTIKRYTTESEECVREMAIGALMQMAEASWSLAVVGHLGPDDPEDQDGLIFVCIARRTAKGNIKIKEVFSHKLSPADRSVRQRMATETCLSLLARLLVKRSQRDERDKLHAKKQKKVVV